jgi:sugar lactone lactonase YvrE
MMRDAISVGIKAEVAVEAADLCGENPVWDEVARRLYWTDQVGMRFESFEPQTGEHCILRSGLQINGFRLNQPGGFILTNSDGVWSWDGSGVPVAIGDRSDVHPVQLNDCVADPEGRLFTGSVFYQPDGEYRLGNLFRVDTDGSVTVVDEGIHLANGLAFSPAFDGLYFADSAARKIYAYDYRRSSGTLSNRRVLIAVPSAEGLPDGLVVDLEGYLWSAQWYGSQVVRYDPDGKVERRIPIPATQVSCLCFAGADLDELYVTTAGRSEPMPVMPPGYDPDTAFCGGPLYRSRPGVRGQPTLRANVRLV